MCTWAHTQNQAAPIERDLEQIDSLLSQVKAKLKNLKFNQVSGDTEAGPYTVAPISSELLSSQGKALLKASGTAFITSGAGLTFSTSHPFNMNYIHWHKPWGFKVSGGIILLRDEYMPDRTWELNASLLRSIHSFNFFKSSDLFFHLYGLSSLGFNWKKVSGFNNQSRDVLYSTPDFQTQLIAGAGTEITLAGLGGVRLAPELGYKASYYISRYQDSPQWLGLDKPEGDFALQVHFAFNMYFYFR